MRPKAPPKEFRKNNRFSFVFCKGQDMKSFEETQHKIDLQANYEDTTMTHMWKGIIML